MIIVDALFHFGISLEDKLVQESIVPFDIDLRMLSVDFVEVGIRHHLEQESEDTSAELRDSGLLSCFKTAKFFWVSGRAMFLLNLMDNVHFKIKKGTINRMLTRSMEMELKSIKLSLWDMGVKQ